MTWIHWVETCSVVNITRWAMGLHSEGLMVASLYSSGSWNHAMRVKSRPNSAYLRLPQAKNGRWTPWQSRAVVWAFYIQLYKIPSRYGSANNGEIFLSTYCTEISIFTFFRIVLNVFFIFWKKKEIWPSFFIFYFYSHTTCLMSS